MASLEMVEKLRQRANVSYDEAKAALEACGDDLLEAMIYLEKQGRVNPPQKEGYYSTQQDQSAYSAQGAASQQQAYGYQEHRESFGDMMRRFGSWMIKVFHKGNTNFFEVRRKEAHILTMPVTVLVLLLVFCFYVTVPLLVVGLFFGCKYRFRGPELEKTKVNTVMDTAASAADELKNEVLSLKKDEEKQ